MSSYGREGLKGGFPPTGCYHVYPQVYVCVRMRRSTQRVSLLNGYELSLNYVAGEQWLGTMWVIGYEKLRSLMEPIWGLKIGHDIAQLACIYKKNTLEVACFILWEGLLLELHVLLDDVILSWPVHAIYIASWAEWMLNTPMYTCVAWIDP